MYDPIDLCQPIKQKLNCTVRVEIAKLMQAHTCKF